MSPGPRVRWAALILGVLGPTAALGGVAASIASCPEFSWRGNALSDLGHALLSPSAVTFNLGLATGGSILLAFSAAYGRRRFPITSATLGAASYMLILVAVFDESYGAPHNLAAVAFFLALMGGVGGLLLGEELASAGDRHPGVAGRVDRVLAARRAVGPRRPGDHRRRGLAGLVRRHGAARIPRRA